MRRFAPGVIDYNGAMATNYEAGRALSPWAAATWRPAVAPFIPARRDLTILDLGSGTGRFATFLATTFGARVLGVEPAAGMRGIALRDRSSADVSFLAGSAERIPLRNNSCDVTWLSQVLHHFPDHAQCAAELRRVLRDPGVVLIRGTFADGAYGFPTLLHFFPGIAHVFPDLPTVAKTTHTFEAHGFGFEGRHRIAQQICASLREFADRTRVRADTSLALLPDDEFASCMRALDAAAAHEAEPTPVIETLDLLVFRSTAPNASSAQ